MWASVCRYQCLCGVVSSQMFLKSNLRYLAGKWCHSKSAPSIASTPDIGGFVICAEANDLSITFNKKQVSTYDYTFSNATRSHVFST